MRSPAGRRVGAGCGGAVHFHGLKQPRDQIRKRLVTAIRNPYVSVIGHSTGRIIAGEAGKAADVDFEEVLNGGGGPWGDDGDRMPIRAWRLDLDDIRVMPRRALGTCGDSIVIVNTLPMPHSTAGLRAMRASGAIRLGGRELTLKNDVALDERPWIGVSENWLLEGDPYEPLSPLSKIASHAEWTFSPAAQTQRATAAAGSRVRGLAPPCRRRPLLAEPWQSWTPSCVYRC